MPNKNNLNKVIKDIFPPIIVHYAKLALKRIFSDRVINFDGYYNSWQEAVNNSEGYDSEEILKKVLDATLKVKNGEALFERDSVLFDKVEYSWPVTCGLLLASAQNDGNLNVLDFGGALGSCYFQNKKFLNSIPKVNWNIVEQTHFVHAGRDFIQDNKIKFYESIEECVKYNKPNVILLSSVLQYLPKPYLFLKELLKLDVNVLILDRTPFHEYDTDKIVIQHVPESIYNASYPMHIFGRRLLFKIISRNFELIYSDASIDGKYSVKNIADINFEVALFVRRESK